jgi:hypothetical protein
MRFLEGNRKGVLTMADADKAVRTQLENIQKRSGKSLDQLYAILRKSGLEKHGAMRDMLKKELGMGHGDANTLVTIYRRTETGEESAAQAATPGEAIDKIYTGPKAGLRPIHDKLMKKIEEFGSFEIAPKKAYVSLRRKKQFATIGPATKTRVDLGLNMKGVKATERLLEEPPGRMCQYKVKITDPGMVDKQLIAWIKRAYDSAG